MKSIVYWDWEAGILKTDWRDLQFPSTPGPSPGSQRYDNHHIDTDRKHNQQMSREWAGQLTAWQLVLRNIKDRSEMHLLANL